MTITQIAAAIGVSVLIAIGGTAPVTNTSETGITRTSRGETPITRESRGAQHESSGESVRVRGEEDYLYVNYETFGMLAVLRMDAESTFAAEMVVGMVDSDYFVGELDGYEFTGTFRVRNAGTCTGMEGTMTGLPVYLVACADGRYVNMVMATDKDIAIETVQSVYRDGEFMVPAGYVEEVY